jgi:hypothetical protein
MSSNDAGLKRTDLNFMIDSIAFVILAFMTTTGLLMRYALPPGLCYKKHTIWGLQRHDWGEVHFWLAVAFFSLMAVHLFLHWRWIVSVATGNPRQGSGLRAVMGVFGLVMVVVLAVSPFLSPITVDQTAKYTAEELATVPIGPALSLKEVEVKTGVPVDHLMVELDIPDNVSPEAKMGDLCKEYGFKMEDVKEVILDYGAPESEKK